MCAFPEKDTVPLTYPHVLGFPLHLQVMTDPGFPFPAMGSVHLTNAITAPRAIAIGETVEVGVRPENLQPHAKGRTVDFVTEVTSAGELVWEARSTYLRRGPAGDPGSAGAPSGPVFDEVETSGVTWSLPGDLGRRYAAVSGDRNPIHLYALTARALGFKRQIAHGMWTKARCVAALENRLPDAVTVEVAFKKPVFLPGRVAFGSKPRPALTSAAAALTSPSARMKPRGIGRPDTGKFCTARWVCAPHSASAGTCSSPMLSCSLRVLPAEAVPFFAMTGFRVGCAEDNAANV